MDKLTLAIQRGLSVFSCENPLTGSEWADKYFYLSKESSSIEGKWVSLSYQKAILDWMVSDDIRIFDFMKSARVGYTKMLMAACGCFIHHKHRNIVIYQPTDGDAEGFAKDEIKTMIRDIPELSAGLMSPSPDKRGPGNTNQRKEFLTSVLDIRGGKSAGNYRRLTKDVVIYDELDAFDNDIEGEGSPLSLGDNRVETSSFPKSIRGTTPGEDHKSLIRPSLEEAELILHRFLPCPHCGSPQRLKWKNFDYDEEDLSTVKYICEVNGCLIDNSALPDMDREGYWGTDNGEYYDEEKRAFFKHDGAVMNTPEHIGVRIWSAYSYFYTWRSLIYSYLEARRELQTGKNKKMKAWVNTKQGKTFKWEKEKQLDPSAFEKRLEAMGDRIPEEILYITLSADIQGGKDARIEREFIGWGLNSQSWGLGYAVYKGDAEFPEVWTHLDRDIDKKFTREDGVELPVSITCIDAGYAQKQVLNFTRPRERKRVYAVKGHSLPGKPVTNGFKRIGKNNARLYMIGTDTAKDTIFSRLAVTGQEKEGFCHFPDNYQKGYFSGLLSEEKAFNKKDSNKYTYQKKTPDTRNEPLDIRVYGLAAFDIGNPNMEQLKIQLDRLAEAIRNNMESTKMLFRRRRRVRSKGVTA